MADPSWNSVKSAMSRYGSRGAAWIEGGRVDADERHALAVESWRLDEAMLYLWTRADGQSLSDWRRQTLAGELHPPDWAAPVVRKYVDGHAARPTRQRASRGQLTLTD